MKPSLHDRAVPRYIAEGKNLLAATLSVGFDDDEKVFDCQLEDIRLQGCSVRLNRSLDPGTKLGILRMAHEDSRSELCAAGKLCWERQTGLTAFTYGFKFRRELRRECLSKFTNAELISLRDERRERLNLSVKVRQLSPQIDMQNADLIDVSNSGMQLRTDVKLTVGANVLVVLENRERCMAEVVWSTEQSTALGLECRAGIGFGDVKQGRSFREKMVALQG